MELLLQNAGVVAIAAGEPESVLRSNRKVNAAWSERASASSWPAGSVRSLGKSFVPKYQQAQDKGTTIAATARALALFERRVLRCGAGEEFMDDLISNQTLESQI